MSDTPSTPTGLSALDRPNSYIGRAVPRPNLGRLLQGRGQFVSDMVLPRMGHVAFVRSPHAHARILGIDSTDARAMPGVIAIVTGAELAKVCTPWVGVLTHLKGLKSAPQHAIAIERACWQGEAVAAVVAISRAAAEDAAERVLVAYDELEPVVDMTTALDAATPVIHAELGDNLAFERKLDVGAVDAAFAEADHVVEAEFVFGRHTGVTLEPRAILADWNPGEERLTVYQGTQAPHMMQNIIAKHLGLEEAQVRVVCKDVGGSFGIKVHVYADEMATAALSKMLRRPVKFVADRLESFNTDIHARDHRCKGRASVKADGTITAFEIDDLTGIGPYSVYPRTSAIEANQVVNLVGGPYTTQNYRARARVVFQNKNVMCQYRAVGHPIACSVTEGLVDLCAKATGIDPADIRRRNLIRDDAYPTVSPSGLRFEALSHHQALDKLLAMMDYPALRADQAACRARGIHRGIGLAGFIEVTNPSPAFYGDRRSAHLLPGRRHRAHGCDRRRHLRHLDHRTGPGLRGDHRAGGGKRTRRAARARPRHARRHRHHPLWWWHLGLTRCRHWRRGGLAGRSSPAPEYSCRRGDHPSGRTGQPGHHRREYRRCRRRP